MTMDDPLRVLIRLTPKGDTNPAFLYRALSTQRDPPKWTSFMSLFSLRLPLFAERITETRSYDCPQSIGGGCRDGVEHIVRAPSTLGRQEVKHATWYARLRSRALTLYCFTRRSPPPPWPRCRCRPRCPRQRTPRDRTRSRPGRTARYRGVRRLATSSSCSDPTQFLCRCC